MAIVKITEGLVELGNENFDEQLYGLVTKAKFSGAESYLEDGMINIEVGNQYLPIQLAMFIVSKGGDLVEYPVHIVQGEDVPEGNYISRTIDGVEYVEVDDKPLSYFAPLFGSILSDVEIEGLMNA